MTYSVKQLAEIAGVSRRTLHYYDQIGLLKPSSHAVNGYRQYLQADLLRLQQIMFYKELGLALKDIRAILDQPGFDTIRALEAHRDELQQRQTRLRVLVDTVDKTIRHLQGEINMKDNQFFDGFDEEQVKEYARQAAEEYGGDNPHVVQSNRRWSSYSQTQKQAVVARGQEITRQMAEQMAGDPGAPEMQALVAALHRHINYSFYTCSYETLRGLGQMYVDDPRFRATYEAVRPGLAEFVRDAVMIYTEGKIGELIE